MFCFQFDTNLAPIPWTVMELLVLHGFNGMESRFQFVLIPTDFLVQTK